MQAISSRTAPVPHRQSSCGFTLLELIIVLVLIGLLMVVTVPTLRNTLIDDPLRSSARKLIGYIGVIRGRAVREQQSYLVYIDLDQNRLWYIPEKDETPDGSNNPPEKGGCSWLPGLICVMSG